MEMNVKICPECGKQTSKNCLFCENCGKKTIGGFEVDDIKFNNRVIHKLVRYQGFDKKIVIPKDLKEIDYNAFENTQVEEIFFEEINSPCFIPQAKEIWYGKNINFRFFDAKELPFSPNLKILRFEELRGIDLPSIIEKAPNLEKIYLPKSVYAINKCIFNDTKIKLYRTETGKEINLDKEDYYEYCVPDKNGVITRSSTINLQGKNIIIPNGVKKIEPGILSGKEIESLVFYSVGYLPIIKSDWFEGVKELKYIELPPYSIDIKFEETTNSLKLKEIIDKVTCYYRNIPLKLSELSLSQNHFINVSQIKIEKEYLEKAEMSEELYYECLRVLLTNHPSCINRPKEPNNLLHNSYFNYWSLLGNIIFVKENMIPQHFQEEKDLITSEIRDIFMNNPNLYKVNIEEAFKNFDYLKKQRIISEEMFTKLFLERDNKISINSDSISKLLKYYPSHITLHRFRDKLEKNDNNNEITIRLPELFNELIIDSTEENRLELRDRLVTAYTLHLLDDPNDIGKISRARRIISRGNFETIVEEDKRVFANENPNHSGSVISKTSYLNGINYPLYEKIRGLSIDFNTIENVSSEELELFCIELENRFRGGNIDNIKYAAYIKNSFSGIILLNGIMKCIYESIDKVDGQDKSYRSMIERCIELSNSKKLLSKIEQQELNEKKNAFQTLLSEEFKSYNISELLMTEILFTENGYFIPNFLRKYYNSPQENINFEFAKRKNGELDKETISEEEIGDFAIKMMLHIDPYSFDCLRYYRNHDLEIKYCKVAKEEGYLFTKEEEDFYDSMIEIPRERLSLIPNRINNYIEHINNQIGIPKIPKDKNEEYLQNVRIMLHNYIQTSNQSELFKLCRSLDIYLRNENQYDIQKDGSELLAKELFDINNPNYTNEDRLIYCMYQFNKLAHGEESLRLKGEVKNQIRLDLVYQQEKYNKAKKELKALNTLSHFGLSKEEVYNLIGKKSYLKLLNDPNLLEEDKISIIDDSRVGDVETSQQSVEIIIDNLKKLKDLSTQVELPSDISEEQRELSRRKKFQAVEKEKKLIGKYVEEYHTYFSIKNMIQEELLNRIITEIKIDGQNARIGDKRKFYKEHGYIAEMQQDKSGALLIAIYSHKYKEPFSVHVQNLSPLIQSKLPQTLNKEAFTIFHTKQNSEISGMGGITRKKDLENTAPIKIKRGEIETELVTTDSQNSYIQAGFITGKFGNNQDRKEEQCSKTLFLNFLQYDSFIIKEANDELLDALEKEINEKGKVVNSLSVADINRLNIITKIINDMNDNNYFKQIGVELEKDAINLIHDKGFNFYDENKQLKLLSRVKEILSDWESFQSMYIEEQEYKKDLDTEGIKEKN